MDSSSSTPSSPLFSIQQTPTAGRAVFATAPILAGTLVWRSNDLALSVILREYRREVCGECFGYANGRDLRVRDQAVGFAFCDEVCRGRWRQENGDIGVQAWAAVESLVKGRSKEDSEMVLVGEFPRPERADIETARDSVAVQASLVRVARQGAQLETTGSSECGVQVTKGHKKALLRAILQPISPDTMSFCLSGILLLYHKPEEWDRLSTLAPNFTPYHTPDDLLAFTRTYLHLLAILPLPLLSLVTPETLFLLSTRDSHNSFGIRSLEDDGSEFFGYGCWPDASYFNHSCDPNIEKARIGREWEFRAARDIEVGEELCISYLGGEEKMAGRGKRMQTLQRNWGFECACAKCEGAEMEVAVPV